MGVFFFFFWREKLIKYLNITTSKTKKWGDILFNYGPVHSILGFLPLVKPEVNPPARIETYDFKCHSQASPSQIVCLKVYTESTLLQIPFRNKIKLQKLLGGGSQDESVTNAPKLACPSTNRCPLLLGDLPILADGWVTLMARTKTRHRHLKAGDRSFF